MSISEVSSDRPEPAASPEAQDWEGLPPVGARWTARRKAQVVRAVNHGLIDLGAVCARYALTVEELQTWRRAAAHEGVAALQSIRLLRRRRESLGKR